MSFLNRYRNIFIISRKEFMSFFYSPIFYIVAILFLGVCGWLFFMPFFLRGQAEMRDFFSLLPLIFTFAIPLITMRVLAEEINTGSYELLATLPVTSTEIILGKYLACLYFIALLLVPTIFYPISVEVVGDLKWGTVVGGYVGAFFLGASYCAIGLFTSSLSRNQIVAAILALVICFALWFVDKALVLLPSAIASFFQYLGSDYHFQNVAKGVLDFRDLLYFATVSFIFIYAARFSIDEKSART